MSSSEASIVSAAGDMSNPQDFDQDVRINVREPEHAPSRKLFTWGSDGTYKRHICKAARLGDWREASPYDETHPNWVSTPLTVNGDTALHVAVSKEQTSFVAKLVERIRDQDMEICRKDGNTAFCVAAISGNLKIATILLDKNPKLVWIRGHKKMLPIQLASLSGHLHMVKYLFERSEHDMDTNLLFEDRVKLFFLTLTSNIYPVALKLLVKNPELASKENEKGLNALQVLAQSAFDKHAPGYCELLGSLIKDMENEESLSSKAMFDAAKSGNTLILEYIFNYYPNLLMEVNLEGQSLLHIAILHRQESVYDLILSEGAYKNVLMQHVDNEGNNVLHLAGKLKAEDRFGSSTADAALISSEEEWFQAVEKIVPPALKIMKNEEGLTPKELFYLEHKKLCKDVLFELNDAADNFLVVATLLISLGITAALTIRTNNIKGKTPLYSEDTWYIIFLLSVAVGVCLCAISLFFFSSIILPRRSKGVYVRSRQIWMMYGCLFILAAVVVMGTISVTSGAILVFTFFPKWIFYVLLPTLFGVGIFFLYILFHYPLIFAMSFILVSCKDYAKTIFQ